MEHLQQFKRAHAASVVRASSVSQNLLVPHVNQSYQASFSPLLLFHGQSRPPEEIPGSNWGWTPVLQYSCLENPMNSMKRQNDRILKAELPRSVGAQYADGDQWRNNSRKNEGMEPKQKQYSVVNVTGDRSKVRCCKEQYCIGTWNVRSVSQGKLEVVK